MNTKRSPEIDPFVERVEHFDSSFFYTIGVKESYSYLLLDPKYGPQKGLPKCLVFIKDGVIAISTDYPLSYRNLAVAFEAVVFKLSFAQRGVKSPRLGLIDQELEYAKRAPDIDVLHYVDFRAGYYHELALALAKQGNETAPDMRECSEHYAKHKERISRAITRICA